MKVLLWTPALAGLAMTTSASAHHSYGMFDLTREVVLTGTVATWDWANPHIRLVLAVDEQGKAVEWTLEGSSPSVLRPREWRRTMVSPGDKITVAIHPLKSGAKGGQLDRVTAADGHLYTISAPAAR